MITMCDTVSDRTAPVQKISCNASTEGISEEDWNHTDVRCDNVQPAITAMHGQHSLVQIGPGCAGCP